MKYPDMLGWFARELGKPANEWKLRHWAAFIAVVALFAAPLLLAR